MGLPTSNKHKPKAAKSSTAFYVVFGRIISLTRSVVGIINYRIAVLVCSGCHCRGPESAMQQRNIFIGSSSVRGICTFQRQAGRGGCRPVL